MSTGLSQALSATVRKAKLRFTSALFPGHFFRTRSRLAARYLIGRGIEIGALHQPLSVPDHIRVRYIDRLPVAELRRHYPELADKPLVDVDIIDDGERLLTIPDASEDFVIANHLIEHTQDPISSIQNWLRVIKPGGILFLGVPNKLYTFDKDRPVTTLQHLIRDYEEGPEGSKRAHFEEWARLVEKVPDEKLESHVERLLDLDYSIHFHVWTGNDFLELLNYCRDVLSHPFSIEVFQNNGIEFLVLLRKSI